MAKKTKASDNSKALDFSSLNSFLSKEVNNLGSLASENATATPKDLISSGIYILDAVLSARIINGGIPSNRVIGIGGQSGTGKTFLCLNFVRQAQKKGYNVIYIDTEATIDSELINNFNIDPSKLRIDPVGTVEQLRIYMAKFIKKLFEAKENKVELPKIMIVLDSLGNLASEKEISDAESGEMKQDMTRAKVLKSLFRVITHKLGILGIPMILTNHTYMTQDLYPKEVFSGGTGAIYNASSLLMLSKAKLKTGAEDDLDLQSGIIVTGKTEKNRMAKPKKVKFEIDFTKGANPFKGLDVFCTKENFGSVGIAKGKKVVDEETGEVSIEEKGHLWYVRHLDKHIPEKQLYNSSVFTQEVLEKLDVIIHDYFKYNSIEELNEFNERVEDAENSIVDDLGEDIENIDGEDLFK